MVDARFGESYVHRPDGKLIVLHEDGWLALATLNPDASLRVLSKMKSLTSHA